MFRVLLSSGPVAVAGSRALPAGGAAQVSQVCQALVAGGRQLVVGCATGADQAAVQLVPVKAVQLFAAFGPGGAGAGPASAVSTVARYAGAGGAVTWWAGGGPGKCLSVRLVRRTRAVVGAAGAGLVVFFASPSSRGSLLAARFALARGLPVLAVPVGLPASGLPLLGPGSWSAVGGGVCSSWVWVPGQASLF